MGILDGQRVVVTGGTGSFGHALLRILLAEHAPEQITIFSRDEGKHAQMQEEWPPAAHPALRYVMGNVRDLERLRQAFAGADVVIHAAALKRVPAGERAPIEPIKTNVLGSHHVVEAAVAEGVARVIALSTDKAANPISLYGASKLCADKLFVAGNHRAPEHTRLSVVRFGNMAGSRGSVLPFFLKKRSTGVLPITDPRMTRFWITLPQAARFTIARLGDMHGGEIFVPKSPSIKITDLATAVGPTCEQDVVGIRPGEKLHEAMIPSDVARDTLAFDDHFAIVPTFGPWPAATYQDVHGGAWCGEGFAYRSDTNDRWLSVDALRPMIQRFVAGPAAAPAVTNGAAPS
ncbi:UDP-N-acetylglucosamine 4,6-dehydratase (inverting) [Salisaeta longa]|uniref:UDP-N-acetylglucosamine 4,6-dehydratase (inverting) n=1 Tax=Salisaeta longa TaxID=503170 RepID=UPI0003B67109|nr:UDP-N-acetylglucosamine 4,6-dehydratase (inverting) [Salisaeta longa]